jgi:hypothetical protein
LTTTHSQSQELSISETLSTTLEVHAIGDERYSIDMFYDRVFGGFAFKQAPLLTFPITTLGHAP